MSVAWITKTNSRFSSILFSSVACLASRITSSSALSANLSLFRASSPVAYATTASTIAMTASTTDTQSDEKTCIDKYDPHKFLEDVLGEKSMEWVSEQNNKCVEKFGEPTKTDDYQRILDIMDSKDKIPVRQIVFATISDATATASTYFFL